MLVRNVIIKYNIFDSNIYNFDEISFFMGMLSHAKVVITSDHKDRLRTKQFGNCEWVSVIQAVCVDGYVLFLYVIVKRKCHFFWYWNGDLFDIWCVWFSENGWIINEISLDWFIHFETCSKLCMKSGYWLLILDGHNNHYIIDFDNYCKNNNIVLFYMFIHLFHIFQPFDVKCFGFFKVLYGKKIE